MTTPVGKEFGRGMRAQTRNPRLGRIFRELSRSIDDHPREVFLHLRCSYSMAKVLMAGMKFLHSIITLPEMCLQPRGCVQGPGHNNICEPVLGRLHDRSSEPSPWKMHDPVALTAIFNPSRYPSHSPRSASHRLRTWPATWRTRRRARRLPGPCSHPL